MGFRASDQPVFGVGTLGLEHHRVACQLTHPGWRVWGSDFTVYGLRFMVYGLGSRVQGLGVRVLNTRFAIVQ